MDQRSESLLVPIYGVMVPFHILMVKSATFNQGDGDHAYIRINFNFGPAFEPCSANPTAIFLKELSLRTSDPRHAAKVGPKEHVSSNCHIVTRISPLMPLASTSASLLCCGVTDARSWHSCEDLCCVATGPSGSDVRISCGRLVLAPYSCTISEAHEI